MNEETSTMEPWLAMSALDLGLICGSVLVSSSIGNSTSVESYQCPIDSQVRSSNYVPSNAE